MSFDLVSCVMTMTTLFDNVRVVLTGLGEKLADEEFEDLRQFMDVGPSGQVSYERKRVDCMACGG